MDRNLFTFLGEYHPINREYFMHQRIRITGAHPVFEFAIAQSERLRTLMVQIDDRCTAQAKRIGTDGLFQIGGMFLQVDEN